MQIGMLYVMTARGFLLIMTFAKSAICHFNPRLWAGAG